MCGGWSDARAAHQESHVHISAGPDALLRALGFDVFDLSQVIPEYTADAGMKKGEKVDYALRIGTEIVMLVEAKPISQPLGEAQYNRLYRYFSVTPARIAILTNGAEVWCF